MNEIEAEQPSVLSVKDLVVEFRSGSRLQGRRTLRALDGVTIDVRPGQVLGIVGQSGSGKSTLARAIVGLEKPTSGQLALNGVPLTWSRASRREMRSHVQMVFQDSLTSLNPRRSIGSTLAEPLVVHKVVARSAIRGRVAELLDSVGIPPSYVNRRPMELSGGQRQRVNVARALASEPTLIVADEPTSALDVAIRAQVLDLLVKLQRERNLTMVFITHDLNVVGYISDTIVVMNHGEVVETAPKDELLRNPKNDYTRALLRASPSTDIAQAREQFSSSHPTSSF